LNKVVQGPEKEWPRAKTVGDMLERVKILRGALAEMVNFGWERTGSREGGYQILEC